MKIIITGGGTAGHINPGLTIAKYIKKNLPNADILFIGTEKGLEKTLVKRQGFDIKFIRVKGFKRKISMDLFISVRELIYGLLDVRKILKDFRPDVVIGTGGYVCGPVVFCASVMRIPCLIHEQNVFPGVTNKILSRFVNVVAVGFEEAKKYFNHAKKVVYTGNPITLDAISLSKDDARNKIKDRYKLDVSKRIVVIFGGSRGSEVINSVLSDALINYISPESVNVIFATGEILYDETYKKLERVKNKLLNVISYIYDMSEVLRAADLVICRSGALTVSELTAMRVPAILIPSPYVTANHQEYNARMLASRGAASMILERDLTGRTLYEEIARLISNQTELRKMQQCLKNIETLNSVQMIYDLVINEIPKEKIL